MDDLNARVQCLPVPFGCVSAPGLNSPKCAGANFMCGSILLIAGHHHQAEL